MADETEAELARQLSVVSERYREAMIGRGGALDAASRHQGHVTSERERASKFEAEAVRHLADIRGLIARIGGEKAAAVLCDGADCGSAAIHLDVGPTRSENCCGGSTCCWQKVRHTSNAGWRIEPLPK